MSVAVVELENWGRFRGKHRLELRPTIYSVTAVRSDDERRSNWSGKSWLLSAISFAATGEHMAPLEDEWISRGETFGLVRITTDAGVVVERSRHKGKSTQVKVTGFGEKSGQKGADVAILEALGVSSEDFFDTYCLEQKKIDRLVSSDPATRQKLVAGWLQLGPLARCCDRGVGYAATAANTADRLKRELRDVEAVLESLGTETPKQLRAKAKKLTKEAEKLESEAAKLVDSYTGAAQALIERDRLEGAARQYADVVRQGIALKDNQPEVTFFDPGPLEAAVEKARAAHQEAGRKLNDAKLVAAGAFDGQCPVDCRECPVADDINRAGKVQRARVDKLRAELERAGNSLRIAKDELAEEDRKRDREARVYEQLEALREKARQLKPAADAWSKVKDEPSPRIDTERVGELRIAATTARLEGDRLFSLADRIDSLNEKRAAKEAELSKAEFEARKWRAAVDVFGRNGAQRRCAEEGLGQIQTKTNELLADAGIDLSVALSWFREGSDWAKRCAHCGEGFPTTATVKQCGNCGAARGKNLIEKLEVVQSNTSGAADDLSGLALQISAAGWLRARRNAAWDTLLIDEPFGACDEANRLAVSSALVSMVRGGGFSQAFVTAHTRDVIDRMPGRIIIEAGPKWSSVKVAA